MSVRPPPAYGCVSVRGPTAGASDMAAVATSFCDDAARHDQAPLVDGAHLVRAVHQLLRRAAYGVSNRQPYLIDLRVQGSCLTSSSFSYF